MLRGDNGTEDKRNEKLEQSSGGKDFVQQSDNVQKAFEGVLDLREKIEQMKVQTGQITESSDRSEAETGSFADQKEILEKFADNEAIEAAEQAVRDHAEREAKEQYLAEHRKDIERREKLEEAKRKEKEARERLEQKQKEAEEKQRQLRVAEKTAAAMKKKRQKVELLAEANQNRISSETKEAIRKKEKEEKKLGEIQRKLEKEKLAAQSKALAFARKEQERKTKELERKKREEEKALKEQIRRARREEILRKREEEAKERAEEQKRREERDLLIAQQREIQKKKREEEREALRKAKREHDAKRAEEKQERKRKLKEERAEKAELRRRRRIAKKSAEKGGGIVSIHGTTVQTEIQPVAAYSVKDLLGTSKRKEIKASSSEEEKQALIEENERIKQEARATAVQLAEAKRIKRADSDFTVKMNRFLSFCDEKKKTLLVALSVILGLAVGTAAVFNYCTAYEYSYDGKTLGYVKNKDEVLQITELVQTALTEEKNVSVVIDARNDIDFRRVYTLNKDIVLDSSDQILKRLTYMGDLNVKAYGIYVDGKKAGAVQDKETAAGVFEDIKEKYSTKASGSEIKEAIVIEKIDVRKSNTPLKELMTRKEMVKMLCTDSLRTTVYTVKRGDTTSSIAKAYNVDEQQLIKDNDLENSEGLEVGSSIIINETAPIITVRITEERTHVEKTPYETIKKKDKNLYEGYTEVDQKGQKGASKLKDRTTTVNGEVVAVKVLENKVQKEPVDKIVRVGTKERPPTVGSGTYIWPAYSGTYTVTSEFKWRWGRQHEGIDLGCSTGTDVLAADGGTVTYAGWMGGYGNLVIIDHQNGIETYYGHNSSLCVKTGDKVFQGQHIAEAGNTGHSFGSHIHFGVKDNGTFKNPRNYLP